MCKRRSYHILLYIVCEEKLLENKDTLPILLVQSHYQYTVVLNDIQQEYKNNVLDYHQYQASTAFPFLIPYQKKKKKKERQGSELHVNYPRHQQRILPLCSHQYYFTSSFHEQP